jgi:hypothetical protein
MKSNLSKFDQSHTKISTSVIPNAHDIKINLMTSLTISVWVINVYTYFKRVDQTLKFELYLKIIGILF